MKFDLFLTVTIFALGPLALSVYANPQPQSAVPSGRCGRDFGLATCERFAGEFCCSQFGFCGGTADHCNAQTCQFGCDNRDPFRPGTVNPKKAPTPTPTPSPQGRCGRDFGFAACDSSPGEVCCSEFGFCGATPQHCNRNTCQFGCDNRNPFLPGRETPRKSSVQLPQTDDLGSVLSCKVPGSISITYDDGPSPLTTTLLNTLSSMNVRTTFFVIGSSIGNPGMKQVVAEAARRGHDIASHSFTHSNFLTLSDQQIRDEITRTETAIFNAIGRRPRYFRPPFGAIDARVARIVQSMGYKTILWNIDTKDFLNPNDHQAQERAYSTAFLGRSTSTAAFISLQHDIHQGTVNAARRIYEFSIRNGYRPQSVSACLQESAYRN